MLEKLMFHCNSDSVAYINGNDFITYKKLLEDSKRLACYISNQGDSPVIVYGHKSINMIISFLACLIAKRAYVPIDITMPVDRIKEIIRLTKSTLIIKNEDIAIHEIESIIDIDIEHDYQNVLDLNNNIAYIIFTSGSTGEPKGVPISYDNLNNFTCWISNLYTLKARKNITVMNQAVYSFDLSVADIYYSLANGHTLVGVNKWEQDDIDLLYNVMLNRKPNVLVMTPTFAKFCLLHSSFNEINMPFIDTIFFCGETLSVKIVSKLYERFPKLNIINAYGPTEATCAVTAILITKDMLSTEVLPVGNMFNNATNILIKDEEIVLNGASVFDGYLGDNNEKNQYYHTGDVGYIKNNFLYCLGRLDQQVKYSGYRIELLDIENNILKLKEVEECVVVAIRNGENVVIGLKAFVVSNTDCSVSDIKEKLSNYIPNYMIPKIIDIVDKIPVNNNGKYDRKLLSKS